MIPIVFVASYLLITVFNLLFLREQHSEYGVFSDRHTKILDYFFVVFPFINLVNLSYICLVDGLNPYEGGSFWKVRREIKERKRLESLNWSGFWTNKEDKSHHVTIIDYGGSNVDVLLWSTDKQKYEPFTNFNTKYDRYNSVIKKLNEYYYIDKRRKKEIVKKFNFKKLKI